MKPSMRLLSELSEAASSWARPITRKGALIVASSFFVANLWATSMQLSAHAKCIDSAIKAEVAVLESEVVGVKDAMKSEIVGVKDAMTGLKSEIVGVKAMLDEVLRRLPTPPKL